MVETPIAPPAMAPTPPPPTDPPAPTPQPLPTPAPEPVAISFARTYVETANDVRLRGSGDTFRSGDRIAWRMQLGATVGSSEVRILIIAADSGRVVREFVFDPSAGSNLFYGEAVCVLCPGTYLFGTCADGLAAEVAEVAAETATATASRIPGVCIKSHPPDLDCGDVPFRRFDVGPPDPDGFDGDGIGCESD